ncbi:MAG: hypothetical protein VYA30_00250 [Myxococcota bacterium]|nr:hypothetical protein [Myxococcota bacterium]
MKDNTGRRKAILGPKRTTLNAVGWLVIVLMGLLSTSCTRTADEATCDKLYTHIIALKTVGEPEIVRKVEADKLESQRFDFLESCVGKYNRKLTACSLSSDSLRKLEQCTHE